MYKVLWLDDQWELFKDDFMVQARKKGIELMPYGVRDEGIAEFRINAHKYEAVLTDALMPESRVNQKMGITGVNTIERIAHEKHIPIFISTGQPGLTKDTTFRDSHENVFIKGDATDDFGGDDELFAAMLAAFEQKESNIVKSIYSDVVASLEGLQVEVDAFESFISILAALHFSDAHTDFNASSQYNSLRIVFENICKAFIRAGVLPDVFIEEGRVNIVESYRYLTGAEKLRPKHIPFYHDGELMPRYIAEPLSPAIFILNAKSHSSTGRVVIPQSKHVLFSYTMLFCEMLVWAFGYIQQHQDIDKNKTEWKRA